MGRAFVRIFVCFLFLAGLFGPAEARRVALVIGNSAYQHASPLANPKNDADALASALERLDFEVVKGVDLKRSDFERTVRDFARAIRGADTALLFYAGHGLQVGGRNYLAPVDARLSDEADLDFETLPLTTILKQMEREVKTNLVFLDACRDNPLARNLARSMGTRSASVGRGLARVDSGIGTLIAFATEPGNVALDGSGSNSPFTQALLKHIETPGLDIAQMMRRVRSDVMRSTAQRQVPWNNSSLTGDFYFAGKVTVTAGDAKPQDDKRFSELQDELKKLKEQLENKPAPQQKAKDDAKLSALQKELAELREELKKRPASKPEPRDDGKVTALQKEVAALKKRLEEKDQTRKDAASGSTEAEFRADIPEGPAPKDETKVAVGVFPDKPKMSPRPENAPTRTLKPGDEFQECENCPVMVVLPKGRFLMGSKKSEAPTAWDEHQQHHRSINKPFAVGKFEVTFSEWDACVTDGGCEGYRPDDRGWGRDKRPVIHIEWKHANLYVDWLSRKTGKPYRLLTEAEWEYAARAGTTTPFHTGETISTDQANFNGNYTYAGSAKGQNRGMTAPAGSFKPNQFGLHDMHGNVWEWVEDCWDSSAYRYVPTDVEVGVSARKTGSCDYHVLRGGSWEDRPAVVRSAHRFRGRSGVGTGLRGKVIGLRVARTLTDGITGTGY